MQYDLVVSRRARHVRISIAADQRLRVTIPKSFPVSELNGILEKRRGWISDRMREIQRIPQLADGAVLRFLDEFLKVRMHIGEAGKKKFVERFRDEFRNELHFFMPAFSLLRAKKMLRFWLALEAKKYFSEKLLQWSQRTGIAFRTLSVRGQKTRWGSASRRGRISLNYKLLLIPSWISDYVIVHELCHLVHMNHSAKFWTLLTEYFPRAREARKFLRMEGKYLVI